MEKLKALVAYLCEAAEVKPEQIEAFTQGGELTPKGVDLGFVHTEKGKRRQIEIGRLKYDGVIRIENFAGSAPQLMALIFGWLADFDPDRERYGLTLPAFDAVLNDAFSSDFELQVDFEELLVVREDPEGPILFDGLKWSLSIPEVVPAEKIIGMQSSLKND